MVAARHPHARFILVGRGPEKLVSSDRVVALGERHDVPRLLRGLDVVVVSSAYGEGFPKTSWPRPWRQKFLVSRPTWATWQPWWRSVEWSSVLGIPRRLPRQLPENSVGEFRRESRSRPARSKVGTQEIQHGENAQLVPATLGIRVRCERRRRLPTCDPNISIGNGPAMDGWGAAELAQITGGRWIDAPRTIGSHSKFVFFQGW